MSIVIKEIQVHTSVEKEPLSQPGLSVAQLEQLKYDLKKELLKIMRRELSSKRNKER